MTTYVAGQELDVNPADVRVNADIGISAWDGTEWQLNAQLADGAAREIATVSPSMRNYIVAQKKIAAAQVAADPVLASLKTTWTEVETASQPIPERRPADRERETWEPTPTDVVLARHDRARVEIREAV